MPLSALLADDWQYLDAIEDVTVATVRADGSPATETAGVKALRRAVTQADVVPGPSSGFEAETTVWHLWTSTLAGLVPKNGDRLTAADGGVWYLLRVELQTLGTRYRCLATKGVN